MRTRTYRYSLIEYCMEEQYLIFLRFSRSTRLKGRVADCYPGVINKISYLKNQVYPYLSKEGLPAINYYEVGDLINRLLCVKAIMANN